MIHDQKRTTRKLAIAITMVTLMSSNLSAQNDFFWSTFALNGGAVNSVLNVESSSIGDTGTLFLYYDATNLLGTKQMDLNLGWLNNDVIAFTSAETLNFDVSFAGVVTGQRWDISGPSSGVTDNSVSFFSANAITAQGIDENFTGVGPGFDSGYDIGSNSFLIAEVEWERVGAGSTTLFGNGSVDNGSAFFADANFGINSVPEPGTFGIFMVGLMGISLRRRR